MNSMGGNMGHRGATGTASGLKGTGYQQASTQSFTPEQMDLFSRLFSQTSPDSYLSRLSSGDQSQFQELEAPAMKQFSELQGSIANRFSGQGLGARNSSGFYNAQNSAAQDFAGQLQSQRMGLQRQALQDLLGLSGSLLEQKPYEQYLIPKQKKQSFWQSLLGGLSGGVGSAAGSLGGIYGANKLGFMGE